ncbi:hypothetical protein [Streptomyces sp. NBC_01506]|uniref:hypothetical protein n=1 Tax=Streptomyces sp. NBC_01506 TaxID=2903887 RepID=UPI0038688F8D
MTELLLVQTAEIPFGRLADFDLVTTGAGPLLVGTHPAGGVCTWDPLRDRWAVHRLDSPWRPGDETGGPAALSALGALVVDGRLVVGGGSDDQPFAQWDLDSGAVRVFADPDDYGVEAVGAPELPGRSLFLVSPEAEAVAVWDAAADGGTGERSGDLNARYDRTAATGMLNDRPTLVTRDEDGGPIWVWDLDKRARLGNFDTELATEAGAEMLTSFALTNVGGRPRPVAAGGCGTLVLGDFDRGTWGEPFAGSEPHDEMDTMVSVGAVDGLPIAVTGTDDPYPAPDFTSLIRAWDLERGRALGRPVTAHVGGMIGVRLTELDGRPLAVTVGRRDASVRVWALDR